MKPLSFQDQILLAAVRGAGPVTARDLVGRVPGFRTPQSLTGALGRLVLLGIARTVGSHKPIQYEIPSAEPAEGDS